MYLALKSLHVIAVIAWMAGLLYLWRLFVYHALETEAVVKTRFIVMERRLLRGITTPAGVVSMGAGLAMILMQPGLLRAHWMQLKLACVLLLLVNHALAIFYRERLLAGERFSDTGFRWLNEMPTLLMVIIVVMVIARPF